MPRKAPALRFWRLVNKNGSYPKHKPELGRCWIWIGALDHGYGRFMIESTWREGGAHGHLIRAHRYSYELENGPIPEGLEPDHLCRVSSCVRPSHIEAVTHKINSHRSDNLGGVNARKTHCPKGHPYTEGNVYKFGHSRACKICHRAKTARQRREKRHPVIR